jgi:hypothetical protein
LFQADAARNGYLNIDRFVFSSGRRKSNIWVYNQFAWLRPQVWSLGYDYRYDRLKIMSIEEWLRKVVNHVGTRPILSNDLKLPRPSSRIDPHLPSLSYRNGSNVKQLRHVRYKYRINSSWINNWGFAFRSDSYYEEETILTNTNPSISQKPLMLIMPRGIWWLKASFFSDRQNFLGMIS